MREERWLLCPLCGGKTRNRVRADTILVRYPLYCPKCRRETLGQVQQFHMTVLKEPDAKTQSQHNKTVVDWLTLRRERRF